MNLKRILTTSGIGLICLSMISLIPSNADRLPYEVKDIFNLKEDILLGASSKDYDLNNDDNINILDLIQMKQEVLTQETQTNNKVLIVYYSLPKGDTIDSDGSASRVYIDGQTLGSVQYMAQTIQETTGGDIFQIETEEEYPNYYDDLIAQAKDEQNAEYRPTLTTHIDNIQDYDTIFIGYPNWWGDMPMALYSFFDEYDLAGKTIIPFNSHGGSRFSNTISTIKTLEPNAIVSDDGLTLSRGSVETSKDTIIEWVQSLGLSKNNVAKTLIAYLSYPLTDGTDASSSASRVVVNNEVLGTTEYFANIIQKYTSGDLFKIEPAEPYGNTFDEVAERALNDQQNDILPELSLHIENLENYDTIFIGYPIWWYDMPQLMYSFFDEYDFSGKTIVLFGTHGGSGFSGTIEIIQQLEPNTTILENGLTISRERITTSNDTIIEWLQGLNI